MGNAVKLQQLLQLDELKKSSMTTTANKEAFLGALNAKASEGEVVISVKAKRTPGGDYIYTWNFMSEDQQ